MRRRSWRAGLRRDLTSGLLFSPLHQRKQASRSVPGSDGHVLVDRKADNFGQATLRELADETRKVESSLPFVRGVNAFPQDDAFDRTGSRQRVPQKYDIVFVFGRFSAETGRSALYDLRKLTMAEKNDARRAPKTRRDRL